MEGRRIIEGRGAFSGASQWGQLTDSQEKWPTEWERGAGRKWSPEGEVAPRWQCCWLGPGLPEEQVSKEIRCQVCPPDTGFLILDGQVVPGPGDRVEPGSLGTVVASPLVLD